MNDRANIRLFLASGHLSPEATWAYISRELRDDLVMIVDDHLVRCEFCRHAIHGLIISGSEGSNPDTISDLNLQIRIRAREQQAYQGISRGVPRMARWAWISAAAVVLIGFVFSFYFINIQSLTSQLNRASGYMDIHEDISLEHSIPAPPNILMFNEALIASIYVPTEVESLAEPLSPSIVNSDEEVGEDQDQVLDSKVEQIAATPPPLAEKEFSNSDMQKKEAAAGVQSDDAISMSEVVTQTSPRGSRDKSPNESEVFMVVEQAPEFSGGMPGLQRYFAKNLKLTATDSSAGGKVIVGFIVDEKGRVREAKILKSVSPEVDKEVLRVVRKMPSWTPGLQRNKPVRTQMTIPVDISPK